MSAFRLAAASLAAGCAGSALLTADWIARQGERGLLLRPVGGPAVLAVGVACVLATGTVLVVLRLAPRRAAWPALAATVLAGTAAGAVVVDVLAEPRLVIGPPAWLAVAAFLGAAWLALLSIGELGLRRRPTRAERADLERARARIAALAPRPPWEPILGDPY